MKLKVIGSSSAGNCYILKPELGKALVLEAGVKLDELGKAIGAYQWSKIAGVLLTHEHGDHAGHVQDFQSRGLKVYATHATAKKLDNPRITPLELISGEKKNFTVGDFKIRWFDVNHDAVHPVGYFISHKEMGTLLFITDTAEIRNRFKGVNHLMIEANYDPDDERFNNLSESHINRVILSHLSIKQADDFIANNLQDPQQLVSVTLIHLSSRHANREEFRKRIERTLRTRHGSSARVEVATPWLVTELSQYKSPNF